jgi:choline dehydrogenase-like flavoprotein
LLNIREDVWKSFYLPLIHVNTAAIFVALARPKSTGRIQLRSADPADHPIINPRYYSHPQDAQVMLEGIRFAEQVIRTPAMRKFNVSLHPEPYPACKHHIFDTDAYWKCYIDQSSFTIYHPVGTCKMGPEKDPEAVVDSQLR